MNTLPSPAEPGHSLPTSFRVSSSGVASNIFWYLIDNSGTVELAVSSKFFGWSGIVSTTAEGGAGAADSATTMYSTTARSNVPYICIGKTVDTQTTAGTWAAVPTTVSLAPFDLLDSPVFTGTPVLPTGTTATTQTAGDNSTKVATTAYVDSAASSGNLQYADFVASGTFTTSANITTSTKFKFTITGGGGGGGSGATAQGGGGGGGGETAIYWVSGLSPSTGYTVTVGAAGTAGSSGAGGNGGNSSVVIGVTTVTANGGSGGPQGTTSGGAGGAGGTGGTNGTRHIAGGGGGHSTAASTTSAMSGIGGASFWGGGGKGVISAAGNDGQAYGSGGSGGGDTGGGAEAGGAGKVGIVTVEWIE